MGKYLSRPISVERLRREFASVWARGGVPGRPAVLLSRAVDAAHEANERRFAECEVLPTIREPKMVAYFSKEVLRLPAPLRLGLIGHECGHLYLLLWHRARHSEDDADDASSDVFGVDVSYDRRWPGKGLQRGRLVR